MNNFSFRHLLLIGFCLWLVGLLTLVLLPDTLNLMNAHRLSDWLFTHLMLFVFIVLVAPVIEEMLFRYGLGRYPWYIFYLVLAGTVTLITSWQIALWVVLLGAIIHLSRINGKWKAVLISTVAFSACHISNFNQLNTAIIPYLMLIFGLGLVLCYYRIKKGILMAILAHMVYNFGILFIDYLSSPKNIHFENHKVKLEMNRSPLLSYEMPMFTFGKDSIVFASTPIKSLLGHMSQRLKNQFHYFPNSAYYQGYVIFKDSTLERVHHHYLGYDTIQRYKTGPGYEIALGKCIDPSEQVVRINDVQSFSSIKGILIDLSDTYKIPIELVNFELLKENTKPHLVNYNLMDDFEESIARISTQIGYELILKEKNLRYTKITYSKKKE